MLLACAHQVYRNRERFTDRRKDGLYWMCTAQGETKHTFNHAFASYALAAYARASGREKALLKAYVLFELIETRMVRNGSYSDSFTRLCRPLINEERSGSLVLTAKDVFAEKNEHAPLRDGSRHAFLYRRQEPRKKR